ncbi:MAG TPA: tryptophan 7-halogenase [Pyrinomonadaceae bacterium]|nr:tryptophan 7-halogenase [Pyrinomonadaceae bacterium]
MPTISADVVVVVGGGPAGSAAAIECAGTGISVALVEGAPFPRERPGETLHPGVEPLFERLGVSESVRAAGFLRHEGNWVEWGGPRRFEGFGADERGAWRGYQAGRARLDALLLDRARESGVRVIQPCRAVCPLLDGARVRGVKTDAGEIVSSFLIDAAGGRHWLARRLGLGFVRRSPPLFARYGYARGACAARDEAPAVVAERGGWIWTARVGADLYQWTRLSLDGGRPSRRPPAEFDGLEPCGPSRGADVTWRAASRPAGPGYFLVGDAAAVLDPASSHGVLKAMMTGMMAARSIRLAIGGADERHVAESYCRWVHDWFEHDVSKLRQLYALIERPAGEASPRAADVA